MKKNFIFILLKVIFYVIGLSFAFVFATALTSCTTASRATLSSHRVTVGVDTTYIHYDGFVKTKNYDKW